MSVLPRSNIQRRPLTIPVERYAVIALVELIEFLEVFVFDSSRAILIEQAERYLVLSVRLGKEILEGRPVLNADPPSFPSIGNTV